MRSRCSGRPLRHLTHRSRSPHSYRQSGRLTPHWGTTWKASGEAQAIVYSGRGPSGSGHAPEILNCPGGMGLPETLWGLMRALLDPWALKQSSAVECRLRLTSALSQDRRPQAPPMGPMASRRAGALPAEIRPQGASNERQALGKGKEGSQRRCDAAPVGSRHRDRRYSRLPSLRMSPLPNSRLRDRFGVRAGTQVGVQTAHTAVASTSAAPGDRGDKPRGHHQECRRTLGKPEASGCLPLVRKTERGGPPALLPSITEPPHNRGDTRRPQEGRIGQQHYFQTVTSHLESHF